MLPLDLLKFLFSYISGSAHTVSGNNNKTCAILKISLPCLPFYNLTESNLQPTVNKNN